MYLGHASIAAGVSRELLERELATARPRVVNSTRSPEPDGVSPTPAGSAGSPRPPPDAQRVRRGDRRRVAGERAIGAERELVRVLLHRPAYFEQVVERVGSDSFRDPELQRIFAALVALGADAGPDALAERLDRDSIELLQELLEEEGGLDHADEAVSGSLALLPRARGVRPNERDRPGASDSPTRTRRTR